jgi:hypothetical protein
MHTVHYRPIKVVLGQVLNVHLELNAHTWTWENIGMNG